MVKNKEVIKMRRSNFGISAKEKKKMLVYVAMIVLGTLFSQSLRELWLDPLMEGYSPMMLLIGSAIGILFLYYMLDVE